MAQATTILVIDDDELVRAYMADALTDLGHKVIVAADGFEGITALNAHPETSLIFLDICMPFADGTVVLGKIKNIRPDVKVVMISGLVDDELVTRTLADTAEVRAQGFITKPFNMGNLEACVEMVLVKGETYLGTSRHLRSMADRKAYKP